MEVLTTASQCDKKNRNSRIFAILDKTGNDQ